MCLCLLMCIYILSLTIWEIEWHLGTLQCGSFTPLLISMRMKDLCIREWQDFLKQNFWDCAKQSPSMSSRVSHSMLHVILSRISYLILLLITPLCKLSNFWNIAVHRLAFCCDHLVKLFLAFEHWQGGGRILPALCCHFMWSNLMDERWAVLQWWECGTVTAT